MKSLIIVLKILIFVDLTGPTEGPQSWTGHRGHSSSAASASKLGGSGGMLPRKFLKFIIASLRCEMVRFQREMNKKMKQKLHWHRHVLSSKLNKFISYNGTLEWNFEPLMVNGNTVVLNHANLEVGSWRSSKSAHVSIIACMSVNTDPVKWFQEDFLTYLIVLKKHATKYNDSHRIKNYSNYTVKTASTTNNTLYLSVIWHKSNWTETYTYVYNC